MRTFLLLIIACLAANPVVPAVALEQHQIEAIDRLAAEAPGGKPASVMARHYAVLLWVEDYCNGRSQESVRNYLLQKGASDRDEFETGWMDTFDMLGKTDVKAMCALAIKQYGPEGGQIRGAWAPRQ